MADVKRITQNTLILTIRMFITMGISIYSSRIILQALGIIDYGIYNVVGGIIAMFSFLNTSMVASTQRFLNYSLGEKHYKNTNDIFNTSLNLHLRLSILIFLISETFGIYFLNHHLNIPGHRLFAANIIFQFTTITTIVNIINIPYKALIIAYEKIDIYAYEAIFQSVITLLISFFLLSTHCDKLILYAFLIMILGILIRIFDGWYCSQQLIPSYKFNIHINKKLSKELCSFSGWTTLVTFAHFVYTQGTILLINIFFGPAVNTAQALANQVNLSLLTFNSNFIMAVKPQIIKSYAEKDMTYMHNLIKYSIKISCLIMGIITLPFIIKTDIVLSLWLNDVPTYTQEFLSLALILSFFVSFSDPITTAIQATGNIKQYQLTEFLFLISILPITYLFFKLGYKPYSTYFIRISIFILFLIVRLYFLKLLLHVSFNDFFFNIILRIICSISISATTLYFINSLIINNFIGFIILCLLSLLINIFIFFYIVFDNKEQVQIKEWSYSKIFNIIK